MNLFNNNKLNRNKAVKHVMKFSSVALSTLCISTSLLALFNTPNALAASQKKAERWFEIEVILFQQLGDKSKLKEQFSKQVDVNNLPKYSKTFDLLTPYLQKDLSAIKQFMPLCQDDDGLSHFISTQEELSVAFPEQDSFIEQALSVTYQPVEITNTYVEVNLLSESQASQISQEDNENIEALEQAPTANSNENTSTNISYEWQEEELNSPLFSADKLCVYTQSDFENILDEEQLADFNIDAFPVASLTGKLNASGSHIQTSPYLISDNSLLLKDISKRLRWSKEFKPLLHFGWRQVGVTRKKAIPLKLFAGQHLANDYQQALEDFQLEFAEAQQQEQNLLAQLQSTEFNTGKEETISSLEQAQQNEQAERLYYAQLKKESYEQLFAEVNNQNSESVADVNIETTINELTSQTLDDLLEDKSLSSHDNNQALDMANPPEKPLQPWFLDGFFKVHLDHYLYITADFNIVNKLVTNTQAATNDENDIKLINFSQNRRVITGEVHYFDHPYLGMVVQIRRFDPSKPVDEAVSQAVK